MTSGAQDLIVRREQCLLGPTVLSDDAADPTLSAIAEDLYRYRWIALHVSYTGAGGSTDGQATVQVRWVRPSGGGTPARALDENAAGDGFDAQTRTLPIVAAGETDTWAVPVDNPGGGRLQIAVWETGDAANEGTIEIWLEAGAQ